MLSTKLKTELAPFVDLRSDAGFKAVLADRDNKDILIGVLNLILPQEARVEDIIEYSDREQRRDVVFGKKTVLDLVCVDQGGNTFIVEMQSSPEDRFFERCVYYGSGLYHLELSDGDEYERLRPVYVVSFLNYRLSHRDESLWDTDRFISNWRFIEKRTGEVADQTISVIFVEMALFTKGPEECVTESDRLFYIFRNGGGFERVPEWIEESGGVPRRLAEACEVAAFSKEKKLKYEFEKMNERDIRAQREYAVREGRKEGFENGHAEGLAKGLAEGLAKGLAKGQTEGRAEGREEGREEGRAEGRAEGRNEAKTEVAKAMLEGGMPMDQISRFTGLTEERIKAL